ncbi:hypothetical protein [Planctomicrobium piriforme]|uniref:MerR HTH family regulatory protein n=1 Tax=Planctomicrobium piriforme TaxID=1576369 RepID=A0A1I3PY56_9PLAN|nr:hypothetical protein [Planctomicrobium piriforme]SFJ26804.1 hypothetical protein SAMN05421753_11785 [Planctomicrobium piriforme]
MPKAKQPLPLLTIRRIAGLTGQPVSRLRHLLDEHPEIQPAAVADGRSVYDRDAFLRVLSLVDQHEAAEAAR